MDEQSTILNSVHSQTYFLKLRAFGGGGVSVWAYCFDALFVEIVCNFPASHTTIV